MVGIVFPEKLHVVQMNVSAGAQHGQNPDDGAGSGHERQDSDRFCQLGDRGGHSLPIADLTRQLMDEQNGADPDTDERIQAEHKSRQRKPRQWTPVSGKNDSNMTRGRHNSVCEKYPPGWPIARLATLPENRGQREHQSEGPLGPFDARSRSQARQERSTDITTIATKAGGSGKSCRYYVYWRISDHDIQQ